MAYLFSCVSNLVNNVQRSTSYLEVKWQSNDRQQDLNARLTEVCPTDSGSAGPQLWEDGLQGGGKGWQESHHSIQVNAKQVG